MKTERRTGVIFLNRFICLHGHFYQPPRENPWIGEIEIQESAAPWHDWNERIAEECYGPNAAARLFDDQGWIRSIVNNYSRISFNFGPTLLSWMEQKRPEYYRCILEADRLGARRFSGHGPAIAQAYNHMIMPLANKRDKITQVHWGMEDFRRRFGRDPEGLWLPETAVDSETLDILTENGIRFVILAPRQADSVRSGRSSSWIGVAGERVDTSRPYVCSLSSGREIAVFFYHGALAQKVAFGDALRNGGDFARMLIDSVCGGGSADPRLVSVATDGETFGHHHKYGDMALAYCLDTIERSREAALTVYGEFLEFYPPMEEVRIVENSSWSCVHGVGRWKEDCGCSAHSRPGWNQSWRAPLRAAMDGLRDSAATLFERDSAGLFPDPWGARNRYIDVFFDRSRSSPAGFVEGEAGRALSHDERVKGLRLMELQLNLNLMYTSCGWFFDDISGIENIQVMAYAARALELCGYLFPGEDLWTPFMDSLERAPSNIAELENGRRVFEVFVTPSMSNLLRAGAHYAFSSLFSRTEGEVKLDREDSFYTYRIPYCSMRRVKTDGRVYVIGDLAVRSELTLDEKELFVAALHVGGRKALCGVAEKSAFAEDGFAERLEDSLREGNERTLVEVFGHNTFSFRHLFKDDQQRILNRIISADVEEVVSSLRRTVSGYSDLLFYLTDIGMPIPDVLRSAAEVVLNDDLRHDFEAEQPDIKLIEKKISGGTRLGIHVDSAFVRHSGMSLLKRLFDSLERSPLDELALRRIMELLLFFRDQGLEMDLWDAQNKFARIIVENGDLSCCGGLYDALGEMLRIRRTGVGADFPDRAALRTDRRHQGG